MSVRAIAPYDFPSSSRQELYGDDQLVHVLWEGNMMFCSAATFRAPREMPWGDFKTQMVDPWAASDPDYDPRCPGGWRVDGVEVSPRPDQTLGGLGVGHKSLITFRI